MKFPEILGKIENLQSLYLGQTAIEELPFSIGNLVGLETIILTACNRLDKLPSSILTLPRLQDIDADSCRRFGISNECEDDGQLELTVSPNKIQLCLSSSNLTDEHLVICLSGFANVVHLDLSYNNFTVLPACIKECIHLKTLLLRNCKQLRDISVIPPNVEDIVAVNCTSLTSQSSSVLLSQAFYETGDKIVMLPGSIPEWFNHCSRERSITFWGREKFPTIYMCAAFGKLKNPFHHFHDWLCILINGKRRIRTRCSCRWPIVAEHVLLFDLRVLFNDSNLRGTFREHDWNHVEVSFEDCQGEYSMVQVKHGPTRMANVKWYGIHVSREESRMEDILLTNAKTLEENNANFERFSEDNYMFAQSRDNGAFHDTYYDSESDDDLEVGCIRLLRFGLFL